MQTVRVLCTDGTVRSVRVDKNLRYPTGWLVSITATPEGESVASLSERGVSGLFSAAGRSLGNYRLANDVEILEDSTVSKFSASPGGLQSADRSAVDKQPRPHGPAVTRDLREAVKVK